MRTSPRPLAAALALLAAAAARADVIEASSTTMVAAGQQTVGAPPGATPDLVTVVPVFELLSVSAREIRNPVFQDLEVVVSGWGSYDLGDARWNGAPPDQFTGDVSTGYVRGQLLGRALTLRAGRAFVAAGAGRMLQLDGGDLLVRLPAGRAGVSVAAFGGVPVAQRFSSRSGTHSWNPAGGDLAYGGRVGVTLPFAGASGRGLELGGSFVQVEDGGDLVRQDVGFDARLQPSAAVVLTGGGTMSVAEDWRLADATVALLWNATRRLGVTADFRYTSPDLFLSRTSILSVFSDTDRKDVGGGVRWRAAPAVELGADYHLLLEPTGDGGTDLGHEATARVEWERGDALAGGEVSSLRSGHASTGETGGYLGGRLYGRRELGRWFLGADVSGHALTLQVNGQDFEVSGTLTAGWRIAPGWSAVVAGRAGVNPFLEQQADLMVKLAWNQTYRAREVK